MNLQRIEELVNERPPLVMNGEEIFRYYVDPKGKSKKISIPVNKLLELEEEEIVVDVLQVLLKAPEDERKVQEADDMRMIMQNAARYIYLREEMFKNQKRGDMMQPLYDYFYEKVDIKYPSSDDLDAAIDALIEEKYKK